jgi:hypothetical protein
MEKKTRLQSRRAIILIGVILFINFLLVGFTSAGIYSDCSIYGSCSPILTTTSSVNYSLVNVNNSNYLQGYTPLTLRTFFENTLNNLVNYYSKTDINNFNASYLNTTNYSYVPYTGANQNVNLGNNNFTTNGTNTISGRINITGFGYLGEKTYDVNIIIPSSASDFTTNGISSWSISEMYKTWNEAGGYMTVTNNTATPVPFFYMNVGNGPAKYRISFKVKSDDFSGKIMSYIGSGTPFVSGNINSTWMTYEGEISNPTQSILYMQFQGTFSGSVDFDDIKLEQVVFPKILTIGTNNFTIDNRGWIGIGTNNPFSSFNVVGNATINGITNTTSLNVPSYSGYIQIGIFGTISETGSGLSYVTANNLVASSTELNKIKKFSGGDAGQYITMRYDRGIWFGTGIGSGDATGTSYTDFINTRMMIDLKGWVGIGEDLTPDYFFDVQGNTSLNDTLFVTNRQVNISGSLNVSGNIYSNGTINATGDLRTNANLKVDGNVNITGNISVKRPYGMFSSTQDQNITLANTPFPITFNWTEDAYQMGITDSNTNFTFQDSGDYLIELSAIIMTDTNNKHIQIWVQKNGINVPRSNTKLEIENAGTEQIISVPFILDVDATTDKFRFMMASDDIGTQLVYTTNTSYSPESPSIIAVMSKISEVT